MSRLLEPGHSPRDRRRRRAQRPLAADRPGAGRQHGADAGEDRLRRLRQVVAEHRLPRKATASASPGLPYQARWYTQGEQPKAELPSDPSAPWDPLFKYPGEPNSGAETE